MIINEGPVFEEFGICGNVLYLYVFCCLCFMKEINIYMLEEQLRGKRYHTIELVRYARLLDDSVNHRKGIYSIISMTRGNSMNHVGMF